MKKRVSVLLLLAVASCIMYSCSQDDSAVANDDGITTLWSSVDSDTETYVGNSVESYVAVIQKISPAHSIAKDFLAELQKYGYEESDLDLDNITRTIMTKSDAVAFCVPNKVNGEMVMAFFYEETYCVIKGTTDGNVANFSTADGTPFASFEHDDASVRVSKTENKALDKFGEVLYRNVPMDGSMMTRAKCCRKEASWGACMSCTEDAFGFVGRVMMLMWQFDVAVAGSCLGAGPNAWC